MCRVTRQTKESGSATSGPLEEVFSTLQLRLSMHFTFEALIYCGILRLQFYPWLCLHRSLQDRPLFGVGVNLVGSLIVVAEESGVKAVG